MPSPTAQKRGGGAGARPTDSQHYVSAKWEAWRVGELSVSVGQKAEVLESSPRHLEGNAERKKVRIAWDRLGYILSRSSSQLED